MLIFIDGYYQEIRKQCILIFILKIIESKIMSMLVLYCYIMQKNSRNTLLEHFVHTNHFQAKCRKRITQPRRAGRDLKDVFESLESQAQTLVPQSGPWPVRDEQDLPMR